ncbi:MAG: phosphoenolpyruvate synthase [Candidatus Kerfeldbacteria bacterium]
MKKIIRTTVKNANRSRRKRNILWYSELRSMDTPIVGGKNSSLGEMYSTLTSKGVRVPDGFAITASAYQYFIISTGVKKQIRSILKDLNTKNIQNLMDRGSRVREAIMAAELPADLKREIRAAYAKLEKEYHKNCDVAVRSSATAEDLPDASFAGQQETFLNIRGADGVVEAVKKCIASLFTNRAISYRQDKGFDHFKVSLSVGVQKMVRSDRACSGVMFSIDTESGFRDTVLINGSWGLGENIVLGRVTPDEFVVFKPTLAAGFSPLIKKVLGDKKIKMVYTKDPGKPTKNIATTTAELGRFCISDREVFELARWAVQIEQHYKKPMDMEWAKDGITKQLYIVQARPETVMSRKDTSKLETYHLKKTGKVLAKGLAVGAKIGSGKARVIMDAKHMKQFKKGEVLVTDITDPDWEPIMKIASAIVTNRGGRTSHAAIVSRELGIPAVVGTENATRVIKTGVPVTVSAAEGADGYVYSGILPFDVKTVNLKSLKRPKTKVMMIVASPEQAFSESFIPNDGVGLLREEFIAASWIKIHPLALLNYPRVKDKKAVQQIEKLTVGYRDKKEYFVDKLSQGIGMIAAAFYPKDVIVRLSDFKTNEYAGLIGGKQYEPAEENPMIGWRGASRYYDPKFEPAFAMECKALRRVREKFGLTNIKVMIPICRTPEEGKKVIALMSKYGLKQHKDGLDVYVMCEVPSNVILVHEFAKIFDGFSIGSNDLTQFTLALDRDSGIVSHIANENNEAVKILVRQAIHGAKIAKRKIGICGQAPSDFPEFAKFLVREGIDSISLNPDTVIKTTLAILETEKEKS